jgi:cytochrome c-type biogenesis protein CcmH/NrfG
MARRQPDEPASQLALWELRWLHAQGRIAAREGRAADARRFVDEARALVSRTPALKDEGPTVAYLAGYVALYTGDAAEARKALASANQTDPFNLMLMAEAAEKTGDAAAAREYWSRILTLNGHGIQHALSRPVAARRVKQ